MAKLKNCSTCSNQIAANAPTCPHCGAINKKPRKSIGTGTGLIIIIGMVWAMTSLFETSAPAKPPETKEQKTARLERELKTIPVEEYKENLTRYKQLLQLHPSNEKYKNKVAYYEPKANRQEKIIKQFSSWDGSHRQFEIMVKNRLKDPDSYEHDNTKYIDKGDHIIVVMRYRAKNSFGGYVVETKGGKFSIDGSFLGWITD